MPPTTVILNGDVHIADRLIFGNQGLLIYLVTGKVLLVPVQDGDVVRQQVGGDVVARLEINSPYWTLS